jgi:hypothetical protein
MLLHWYFNRQNKILIEKIKNHQLPIYDKLGSTCFELNLVSDNFSAYLGHILGRLSCISNTQFQLHDLYQSDADELW